MKKSLLTFAALPLSLYAFGLFRTLRRKTPAGTSFRGPARLDHEAAFLYDVTYQNGDKREEQIFPAILNVVAEAESFLLLDMFLFHDAKESKFPPRAEVLTDQLIQRKREVPQLQVAVITDRVNTVYGGAPAKHFQRLEHAGIPVIFTETDQLRDSNPLYAPFWRGIFSRINRKEGGSLINPINPKEAKVPLRSYLELVTFKANHRKTIASEKEAIVASANPHNESAWHSNVAVKFSGTMIEDLLRSEQPILHWSPRPLPAFTNKRTAVKNEEGDVKARILTESRIKEAVLKAVQAAQAAQGEDILWIASFYVSERTLMAELKAAAARGVDVRLILDDNEEAFGRKKGGIPNRPAAEELAKAGVNIRWYQTGVEQFHTKLLFRESEETAQLILGSANFTRRNLNDFNLETNVAFEGSPAAPVFQDASAYLERLWENKDETFTCASTDQLSKRRLKQSAYQLQERSGLSTF
ncbi:phosphatidylserine/phosphatidylglycerophosphate/cardiolipin synthase-like enzyme [Salsuginibacillus halophilus]|uniref:Phosphatidylserine/phosphatidylglycerophosphate/ cardiolipin synthase-like enzyme n=1 Tax=Salsuginibacillus halophilus TaxID=517424 RepID=A0A2P8HG50_9BACI|nr:phospholipase D-like domain-containing protein [Salsuginibacillus halophilus]PSL45202.1 phosphatidylserine/phosphatidylglycerophosphate/cardiolipin synthase-like enzyme [Salsuginibacillus halophilus]